MIHVQLVHDVGLLRCALAALVEDAPDMSIRAGPWGEALRCSQHAPVDVCVVDGDSVETATLRALTARLRPASSAQCGLLALVSRDRPGVLRRVMDAGAVGFVGKEAAAPDLLLAAIRQVAAGRRYLDESLAGTLLKASEVPFSPRELSVLEAAAEGASMSEIARRLCLSAGTVRNYMSAINRKTGARNRVDAIRISQGAGWL